MTCTMQPSIQKLRAMEALACFVTQQAYKEAGHPTNCLHSASSMPDAINTVYLICGALSKAAPHVLANSTVIYEREQQNHATYSQKIKGWEHFGVCGPVMSMKVQQFVLITIFISAFLLLPKWAAKKIFQGPKEAFIRAGMLGCGMVGVGNCFNSVMLNSLHQ